MLRNYDTFASYVFINLNSSSHADKKNNIQTAKLLPAFKKNNFMHMRFIGNNIGPNNFIWSFESSFSVWVNLLY